MVNASNISNKSAFSKELRVLAKNHQLIADPNVSETKSGVITYRAKIRFPSRELDKMWKKDIKEFTAGAETSVKNYQILARRAFEGRAKCMLAAIEESLKDRATVQLNLSDGFTFASIIIRKL